MSNSESCCLAKILKVIDILQKRQKDSDCFDLGCTKPIFGPTPNIVCYNTRPITLYNKDNSLLTVSGCCAKLRVLIFNSDDATYTKTNQFVTVNLKCFCAVKCLEDAVVDC